MHNAPVTLGASARSLVWLLARGVRPGTRGGMAAWRRVPVAMLLGLVLLAVGPSAHAAAPEPTWPLGPGYSDPGDNREVLAALEVEAAPAPSLSDARPAQLQARLPAPKVPGPTPSRLPVVTRDRSPPLS